MRSRRPFGDQVHRSANPGCPIYEELRGILRKTVGGADVLRVALAPHVYGLREFRGKIAAREPFLLRVAKGPKIFLLGNADALGKCSEHGSWRH